MNKIFYLIFFAVFAAHLTSADRYSFQATYEAVYSTMQGAGSIPGTLYFRYDSATPKNSVVRYDHTVYGVGGAKATITEFENYNTQKIYKICPDSCESFPVTRDPDPWWYKSTDTLVSSDFISGDDGATYYRYNRNSAKKGGIKYLYLKKTTTAHVVPSGVDEIAAKVVFNDNQAVTLKKSSVSTTSWDNGKFTMPSNSGCLVTACKSYLDIVFVLDESGSINSNEFGQMRTFLRALAGNLTIGYDAAAVAITMFGKYGRTVFDLTYSSVDGKIQNFARDTSNGSYTRQGLGLEKAYSIVTATTSDRRRNLGKPTQFVIALTDGADHDYNNIQKWVTTLKNYGVFIMEVGVGISDYYANKLKTYASTINGEPAYFPVSNFQALLDTINKIVVPICDNSDSTKCDSECHGYCGCSLKCYCPECTPTGTKCSENTCVIQGDTTNGCVTRSTKPNYDCTITTCDPQKGWVKTGSVVCDANRKTCEDEVCTEPGGCKENKRIRQRCEAGRPSKCHDYQCDPKNSTADPVTGCVYEDKCTGKSDSRITYAGGVKGCMDYICTDNGCTAKDACPGRTTITDCMIRKCNMETHQCDIAGEGSQTCKKDSDCYKDECTTPHCGDDGSCVYTPKYTVPDCDGCYKVQCNATTKKYERYYVGCGSTDKCMEETCQPNTGECTYKPKYDYRPCFDLECDKKTGEARYVPRNCSDPAAERNSCRRFRCNPTTDSCEEYQAKAEEVCHIENAKCYNITCSGAGLECQFEFKVAPGVTNCSLSRCDPETGIAELYDKCDDGLLCTIDSCSTNGTCSYKDNDCKDKPTANMSSCFYWSCSESRKNGCYRKIFDNAFFDECGNCIGSYSDTRNVTNEEMTDCKKALTWEEKAAVISAGVAGAIVAACVIGAIGVSVGGTLLTRELIKRARAAADSGAVENPMYQDNGREMSNPAFEGEDADS